VAATDVNGDGRPDLVANNISTNMVAVLLNQTAPGAGAPSFAPAASFVVGNDPAAVSVADVNGDGRPDLVATNRGDGNVSILLNTTAPGTAPPSFIPAGTFATDFAPQSVVAADVNGDGRPDLLVAAAGSTNVSVLLNATVPFGRPAANFAAVASGNFQVGSNPQAVAAADVNGDGRPDLLVANDGSNDVSVLLNTTAPGAVAPNFGSAVNFAAGSGPQSVATADVNGDGQRDLLVANSGANTVSVLLNLMAPGAAPPSFAPAATFAAGSGPQAVAAADVNGDGRAPISSSPTAAPTPCRCC
jgi:predicted short-subunit dehydrogenase-like oxidoreductase (DUF2520 family)